MISYVWNLKKPNANRAQNNLLGAGSWEKWGDIGQSVQTHNYKMKKF